MEEYSHDDEKSPASKRGAQDRGRRLGGKKRQRAKPSVRERETIVIDEENNSPAPSIVVISDSDDDVVVEKVVSAERTLTESQNAEYEKSLQADRLKEIKRAREEREKREIEDFEKAVNDSKADAIRRRRERFERQPRGGGGGGIRLKFRLPDGSCFQNAFWDTATLDDLRDFLQVVAAENSAPENIDFVDAVSRKRLVELPTLPCTLLVIDKDA